jgi:hypothetical protein
MTLRYRMQMNTFDKVASYYDRIKPVVSVHHKREDDVRPLGDRRRKWERIIKVDADTYALSHNYSILYSVPVDAHKAPHSILWHRAEDGTETVTVTLGNRRHDVSMFNFLTTYLPTGLDFLRPRDGKKYIRASVSAGECKTYFLQNTGGRTLTFNSVVSNSLVFRRVGDLWELISKEIPKPKRRVDKEAKAALKPAINEFWNWACIVAPMLQPAQDIGWWELYHLRTENVQALTAARHACGEPTHATFHREALTQEGHPARTLVLQSFLIGQTHSNNVRAEDTDPAKLRAAFNSWVNRVCEFNKIVTEV